MPDFRRYVFVMWGNHFEGEVAAIFVSELRQAGLRVKIVGLNGQSAVGTHGLVLVPDLTLGQALPLAHKASCVVIPCDSARIKRLKNDPRINDFLYQANKNNARFVVGQIHESDLVDVKKFLPFNEQTITYPDSKNAEELIKFTHSLPHSILGNH